MSIAGRTVPGPLVALAGLAMVVAAMIPVLTAGRTPDTREIRLVARDMAFYLEGDPDTPNPTLELRAGQRVTITLRNEERGITHDFAAPALAAGLDLLKWGQIRSVTVVVPDRPGFYEYVCRPHRLMMRGVIRVVADGAR
jgi:plastocyanin